MKSDNHSSASFIWMLLLLFIGLKLTGHIDWSWWWVMSPLWITIVIGLIVGIIILIGNKYD